MKRLAWTLVAAALVAASNGGSLDARGLAESVAIVDHPASLTSSTTAAFAFTGSAGVTVFRCGLDGDVPSACSSPKTYTGLSDGKHTFVVRGYRGTIDLNVSDTREWTIDSTPPETTIASPVPAQTKAAGMTIAFTSSEPSTFECKLDSASFQACTSPVTVNVGFGAHTFSVRARDAALNPDPTPATATWTRVANVPPVARVGFLARPGKPNAKSKDLIGAYALPKALLGVDNVSLPVGEALKLSAGKLLLPAGATIPVVIEGKPYTFTGAASSDADGKIVRYEWSVFTGGKWAKKQDGASAVFTTSFKEVGGWSSVRLVVVDDEGAGASTEFIVKIDANCVYEIVRGKFRAEADCFRRKVVFSGAPKKGQASPAALQSIRWTTDPAGYPARINGITVDPEGKTKKLVTQNLPLVINEASGPGQPDGAIEVKSVRARVSTPEAQLYLGHVSWKVEDGYIANFELGGKITPTLRGLRIAGLAALGVPILTPTKGAAMKLWIALPEALGGVTSDESVPLVTHGTPELLMRRAPASANASGDLSFEVENASISPYFTVRKLTVTYVKAADRWTVKGLIVIDALAGVEAKLGLVIEGKSLKEILAQADNLNLCALQLVCLQKLLLNVVLDGKNGDTFEGQAGVSLFQKIASHTVAKIDGGLILGFPSDKKPYVSIGGDVYVFDAFRVASGSFAMDTSGYTYIQGQAKLFGSLVGIGLSVDGKVYAEYEKPHLDLYGKVDACLDVAVVEACAGAEALASTKALAVCLIVDLVLDDWRPGFAYEWGGGLTIFAAGCDVGPYKAASALRRGSYDIPAGDQTILLPTGLPGAVVAARGATAPPKVTLIGPNGEQVSTPSGPGAVRERPFWLVQVPATKTTYIAISKPSAGTWKLQQQPGSSPVAGVSQADGIAPPSVDANVLGSGFRRALSYSLSSRPGQSVTFWERSLAGRSGPPAAAQVVGTVESSPRAPRQRGKIAFTPALGPPGKREIVAQVVQDGVPRRTLVVDTYVAPPLPALGAPPKVSVERAGSQLRLSWDAAPQASAYVVRLQLADGQRRLFHTVGAKRAIVVRGMPAGVGGTARVTSLRLSTGTVGPTKKVSIPG